MNDASKAPDIDIDTLGIKALKEFIVSHGLTIDDCIEKDDLRTRAKEALAREDKREESTAWVNNFNFGVAFFGYIATEVDPALLLQAHKGDETSLHANLNAYATYFDDGPDTEHGMRHTMSLKDDEYFALCIQARSVKNTTKWKGRARDYKGQFYQTKYEDDVLLGFSHRTYKWVLVIPQGLSELIAPFVYQYNKLIERHTMGFDKGHASKMAQLASKQQTMLERDYSETQGKRAAERGLNLHTHRKGLCGRRNHFVAVPKTL